MAGSKSDRPIALSPKDPGLRAPERLTAAGARWYVLLLLLIAAAVWARFSGLAWHFTHNDDIGVAKTILDRELASKSAWFVVPRMWTYAPFQFLFTHLFISPEDTYRELLFWGRIPSALAGISGVLLILHFYRRLEGKASWTAFSAAVLAACSWENIIHAQQMHNYALGVPAAVCILMLALAAFRRKGRGFAVMVFIGASLGILVSMHYQILFFLPAFFLTIFLYGIAERVRLRPLIARMAAGGAAFLLVFYPLWQFFIIRHLHKRRDGWNWGPAQEFVLRFSAEAGPGEKIAEAFVFYIKNFFCVLHANLAFVPEGHFLYVPVVYYLFSIFFVLGTISFFDTSSREKKFLGLFFALTLATWFALVALDKMALAPTRHNLILLPLMAIVTAEGAGYLFFKLTQKPGIPRAAHGVLTGIILCGFFMTHAQFLEERRDPFDEEHILRKVKEYKIDALIPYGAVQHITAMKSIRQHYGYYMPGVMEAEIIAAENPPYETIAWISHRVKLTPESFEEVRKGINDYLEKRNLFLAMKGKKRVPFLRYRYSDYIIVYSEVKESETEIDYSSRTKNGPNSYYFHVLKRIAG